MRHRALHCRAKARGLTLIELMVAMVLGLVLLGGVGTIVIANGDAYRTNEGLSQVQESSRTAFELLARDIREAGATACGSGSMTNVVNDTNQWWQEAWTGVRGYPAGTAAPGVSTGGGVSERVAGTDAIMLQGMVGAGVTVDRHNVSDPAGQGGGGAAANFQLDVATTAIGDGDIVIVCDFNHAAIFQITNYDGSNGNVTVRFNTGNSTSPGNCTKGLGPESACGSPNNTPNGDAYSFENRGAQIARLATTVWYVGNNGRANEGGRSLYRRTLGAGGATIVEEVVPGITDMQLEYRVGNAASLTAAPNAAEWENVTAVEVQLAAASLDARISTADGEGRLQRNFTTIIGVRNAL